MSIVSIRLYEFARKEMNLTVDKAKAFVEAIDDVVMDDIKGGRTERINYKIICKR